MSTNKYKMQRAKRNGFTLVETLVSIAVLSLSILGTFTAVQASLAQSNFAKDQITAFYLAQDAVEYIRNLRDNNGLANIAAIPSGGSVDWLTGISKDAADFCYFGKYCYIDSVANSKTTCSTPGSFSSCPFIKQDSNTGLFSYTAGSDTKFKRAILIQSIGISPYKEIVVNVRIDWTTGVFSKSVTVKQTLMDIR